MRLQLGSFDSPTSPSDWPLLTTYPDKHTRDRFPDGEINPTLAFDGCYTIYELFRRSVAIYPNRPFLGHRPIDSEVRGECVCACVCVMSGHTSAPITAKSGSIFTGLCTGL